MPRVRGYPSRIQNGSSSLTNVEFGRLREGALDDRSLTDFAKVGLPLSETRELALGWNATMGRVLVHRARQLPREPGEQLLARQPCLLGKGREHVGSDGL